MTILGRRVIAHLIDLVYQWVTILVFFISLVGAPPVAFFAFIAGVAPLWLLASGRSIGKISMGLLVVCLENGHPAGFWRMLGREVLGKYISTMCFNLGYLWLFIKGTTWHDMIFGTDVVLVGEAETTFKPYEITRAPRPVAPAQTEQPVRKSTINYYRILGVSPDASEDDIDAAYKQLAASHNTGQSKTRMLIDEAYGILGDPLNRKQYDEMRRQADLH